MHPGLLHFGPLTIPAFGLLAALGLILALMLSQRTAVAVGLNPDRLWNAGLFAIIAAFVLSRLLLVLTNLASFRAYPILLLMVPSLTPLGLLLTIVLVLFDLRRRGLPLLATLDAWAPCATLVWAFLALGHQLEGSDPGTPSNLPWARPAIGDGIRVHPVGIYVAVAALLITAILLLRLRERTRDGYIVALALVFSGLAQFLLTFVREPAFFDNALGNILDPIQWVALVMIAAGALIWQQPRRHVAI